MNKMNSQNRRTNGSKGRVDLLSQEEQYKKLNAELEAKTASLVEEADAVLRGQAQTLATPSLLDKVHSDDFVYDWLPDDEENTACTKTKSAGNRLPTGSARRTTGDNKQVGTTKNVQRKMNKSMGVGPTPRSARPQSAISNFTDEGSAVCDSDYSLHTAMSNIERRLDNEDHRVYDDDDVLPAVAAEMGSEAQIRLLKAKLRVLQEEIDRVTGELVRRDELLKQSQSTIKELEEERNKLQRKASAQQVQSDKYKKLAEDAKNKTEDVEVQLTAMKKEQESLKREIKQQSTNQSAAEVRLNRALEETEKYKAQLDKARSSTKESSEVEKRRLDQLMADNKRLEKQKNELMNGFKKQLKLIDVLKRQKMHIEAAKMLSFTEEEFIKALDWEN